MVARESARPPASILVSLRHLRDSGPAVRTPKGLRTPNKHWVHPTVRRSLEGRGWAKWGDGKFDLTIEGRAAADHFLGAAEPNTTISWKKTFGKGTP